MKTILKIWSYKNERHISIIGLIAFLVRTIFFLVMTPKAIFALNLT